MKTPKNKIISQELIDEAWEKLPSIKDCPFDRVKFPVFLGPAFDITKESPLSSSVVDIGEIEFNKQYIDDLPIGWE